MKKQFSLRILGGLMIAFMPVNVGAETMTEAQLKTVYLYNFVRFVQWPAAKTQSPVYQICIYPYNRFGALLFQLEKRKVAGKSIQIKELASVDEIEDCHAIFIDTVPREDLNKALAIAEKHHILTISDQHEFAGHGGMIELFMAEGKIRFNINYHSSQQAALEIDSKLIGLASHVIRTRF